MPDTCVRGVRFSIDETVLRLRKEFSFKNKQILVEHFEKKMYISEQDKLLKLNE